jgi:hypothetical protein
MGPAAGPSFRCRTVTDSGSYKCWRRIDLCLCICTSHLWSAGVSGKFQDGVFVSFLRSDMSSGVNMSARGSSALRDIPFFGNVRAWIYHFVLPRPKSPPWQALQPCLLYISGFPLASESLRFGPIVDVHAHYRRRLGTPPKSTFWTYYRHSFALQISGTKWHPSHGCPARSLTCTRPLQSIPGRCVASPQRYESSLTSVRSVTVIPSHDGPVVQNPVLQKQAKYYQALSRSKIINLSIQM